MRPFADFSIKGKLTVLTVVSSGLSLLLIGVLIGASAVRNYRQGIVSQLSTQAEMVGYNSAAALIFNDPHSAGDTLAALRAEPQIRIAAIYRPDGRLFASFSRDPGLVAPASLSSRSGRSGSGFGRTSLVLTHRIGTEARPVGTVYLEADLAGLRHRILVNVGFTGLALAISLGAAIAIARALQRGITEPVLDLVKTARAVADDRDYSRRADVKSRDELGVLVRAFNEMLDQIQKRDAELRKVNRELGTRTAELGRKNEEVEAFVYIVSHDLRGPLVNLQGFGGELEKSCKALATRLEAFSAAEGLPGDIREILVTEIPASLRFISASTTKFERLINALLQLSRSGRQEYRPEPLDMAALARSTVDSLQRNIEKSGAEVVIGNMPAAFGDATAVGQVLSNLLMNAVNYLQPGRPGRIEIGGEPDPEGSGYWVRDNGAGIPEAAQRKLFQVFQRFHPKLAAGEGIGLATVKRIVERHGGRIWAESVEGLGTSFRFTLPGARRGAEDL